MTEPEGIERLTTVSARPPHLGHDALVKAQAHTLAAPRRSYGVLARILFFTLDALYGRERRCQNSKCSSWSLASLTSRGSRLLTSLSPTCTVEPDLLDGSTTGYGSPASNKTTSSGTC